MDNKTLYSINTQETVEAWRNKYIGYRKKINLHVLDTPTVIYNTIMVGSDDFDLPGIVLDLVKLYQPTELKKKTTNYSNTLEPHLTKMGVDPIFDVRSSEFTGDAVNIFPIISKEDFRLSDSYKIMDLAYDNVFDGFTTIPTDYSINPIIPFVILFDDEDSNGKRYINKYNQPLLDILTITYTKHMVCGYNGIKDDFYEVVSLVDRNTSKNRYTHTSRYSNTTLLYGLERLYFDRDFGYDKYSDAISMRDIKNSIYTKLNYEVLTYLGNTPLYQLIMNELFYKDLVKD